MGNSSSRSQESESSDRTRRRARRNSTGNNESQRSRRRPTSQILQSTREMESSSREESSTTNVDQPDDAELRVEIQRSISSPPDGGNNGSITTASSNGIGINLRTLAALSALQEDGEGGSLLSLLIHHQVLNDLLQLRLRLSDSDDDDAAIATTSNDSDSSSSSSSSGDNESRAEVERREEEAKQIKETADKIIAFRLKVCELIAKEREGLETKIDNALDIQNTLSDLVRQQKLAADKQDQQQLESVQGVIQDIKGHKSFLSVDATSVLRTDLESLRSSLSTLTLLTSDISSDDEVNCVVCYSCPDTIIWDCIECNCVVCNVCKRRLTACPTCRTSYRTKAPRRNRWAEKLAKLQRQKMEVAAYWHEDGPNHVST